jgi:hypothetical protein
MNISESIIRNKRLKKLGFRTYDDFLLSELWETTRHNYGEEYPPYCSFCGSEDRVQLHHKTYKRLGEEIEEDLAWLCQKHHIEVTESGYMPKKATDKQKWYVRYLGFEGDVSMLTHWDVQKFIMMKKPREDGEVPWFVRVTGKWEVDSIKDYISAYRKKPKEVVTVDKMMSAFKEAVSTPTNVREVAPSTFEVEHLGIKVKVRSSQNLETVKRQVCHEIDNAGDKRYRLNGSVLFR